MKQTWVIPQTIKTEEQRDREAIARIRAMLPRLKGKPYYTEVWWDVCESVLTDLEEFVDEQENE